MLFNTLVLALASGMAMQVAASPAPIAAAAAAPDAAVDSVTAMLKARQSSPDQGLLVLGKPPSNNYGTVIITEKNAISRFCENYTINYGTAAPYVTTWLGNNFNCRFYTQNTDCSGASTFIYAGNSVANGTLNISPKSFVCQYAT